VVRRGKRGLSGAVLAGFKEAKFDRFVVLDGDLQHPPEMVPQLLARLDQGTATSSSARGTAGLIGCRRPAHRAVGRCRNTCPRRWLA
jgi:dolichol-phosphate mannosyltransferase